MRWLLLLIAMVGSTAAIAATKTMAPPVGLYGNVRMSAQTGDLGGQEIRFFTDDKTAKSMVEFVSCEGWCNATHTVPLERDTIGYWFEYTESFTDGDGTITDTIINRYRVKQKGRRIILTGTYSSCAECDPLGPFILKPLKQSFGIAVANNEP
jgi:hypothetical protein